MTNKLKKIIRSGGPILIPLVVVAVLVFAPSATYAEEEASGVIAKLFSGIADFTLGAILKLVTVPFEFLILPLAGLALGAAGAMLDYAITYSLNTAYIASTSAAIDLSWTLIRDFCNMLFIFLLIWISFATILRANGFNTKKMLTSVIIAALLINFSLFFTKLIVDVGNIFGNWLYSGIQTSLKEPGSTEENPSLSFMITKKLNIVNLWVTDANSLDLTAAAAKLGDLRSGFMDSVVRLLVVLVATYVFIYAAFLFIARLVTILFLLVFSPVGFIGKIVPKLDKYAGQWWDELWNTVTFPVAFLLVLYVAIKLMSGFTPTQFTGQGGLGAAELMQNAGVTKFNTGDLFYYIIVIALLLAALKIAKETSGSAGKFFGGIGGSVAGFVTGSTFGIAARGGRIVGGGAAAMMTAEKGKRWSALRDVAVKNIPPAKIGKIFTKEGRTAIKDKTVEAMKTGTWDLRNINVPGQGKTIGALATQATGVSITGQTTKEMKEEKGRWEEEKKIETANTGILKQIRDIEAAKGTPQYDQVVKNAKINIADASSKLSNKQLEKLSGTALKDKHFIQSISQSQVEHLAEKTDWSDEEKAKVWQTRLAPISEKINAGASPRDIKDALRVYSDKELENLGTETLTKPGLVNPDAMNYEKFGSLMKSSKITYSAKEKMRDARYEALDNAIMGGNGAMIETELDKLDESEIAKIGWKKAGQANTRLSHPEVIYRLTPKTLGKLIDELSAADRNMVKQTIQNAPNNLPQNVTQNCVKAIDWFDKNPIGRTF